MGSENIPSEMYNIPLSLSYPGFTPLNMPAFHWIPELGTLPLLRSQQRRGAKSFSLWASAVVADGGAFPLLLASYSLPPIPESKVAVSHHSLPHLLQDVAAFVCDAMRTPLPTTAMPPLVPTALPWHPKCAHWPSQSG